MVLCNFFGKLELVLVIVIVVVGWRPFGLVVVVVVVGRKTTHFGWSCFFLRELVELEIGCCC